MAPTIADRIRGDWPDISRAKALRLQKPSFRSLMALPPELVDLILADCSLGVKEHVMLSRVCRSLRHAYDETVWKALLQVPPTGQSLSKKLGRLLPMSDLGCLGAYRTIQPPSEPVLQRIFTHDAEYDRRSSRPYHRQAIQKAQRISLSTRRGIDRQGLKIPSLVFDYALWPVANDKIGPRVYNLWLIERLCLKVFDGPEGYAAHVLDCERRKDSRKATLEQKEVEGWAERKEYYLTEPPRMRGARDAVNRRARRAMRGV